MEKLKSSYGIKDNSKTFRFAVQNCPTKEEFEKQDELVKKLEGNVKALYERHLGLEQ